MGNLVKRKKICCEYGAKRPPRQTRLGKGYQVAQFALPSLPSLKKPRRRHKNVRASEHGLKTSVFSGMFEARLCTSPQAAALKQYNSPEE